VKLDHLVAALAPILWLSPDEVLSEGPSRLPCDEKETDKPVVYWRLSEIRLSGPGEIWGQSLPGKHGFKEPLPAPADPVTLDLRVVSGIRIAFYFFYDSDFGFGGHPCDLESVEMTVNFRAVDQGYVGTLVRVIGAAHGVGWYSNILDITSDVTDVKVPLTLLVEENKHATCPDRNGDGYYNPGYDVNRRLNDAWGVRDDLGSGVFSNARYSAAMTKTRRPETRIFPPGTHGPHERTYELRRDNSVDAAKLAKCGERKCTGSFNLAGKLRAERFGQGPMRASDDERGFPARQSRYHLAEMWGRYRGDSFTDHIPLSYRNDRGSGVTVGFALQSPLVVGWLVPKVNFFDSERWGLDVLYTPSASRAFDWYAGFGFERERVEAESGDELGTHFASELGIRFRVRKGIFWGGRLGVRARGRDLSEPRLVFEAGVGSF
jgi:hypothetical protein